MEKKVYITEEERKKCRKVADAFAELEDVDVVVIDVGRYGFVKLQYYTPPTGFENDFTFTDSRKLFDDLWEEWLHSQLIVLAKEMKIDDVDYDYIFRRLPEEKHLDMLCRKLQFKRTHSVIEREGIYARVQRYKKRLQPDYDSGLCLETVQCIFTLPQGEAEKYRMTHDGQETYAFIMSNRYILGLFTFCESARKSAVMDGAEYRHLSEQEQKIMRLDRVGDVLFQALLLDDVRYGGNELCANLYTIYCLNEK